MPDDPAGLLLDRLRSEGRRVYLDCDDRGILRVSGAMGEELIAELKTHKAALLQLLEAEALHDEIARSAGDPFAGGQGVALIRYSAWRVPRWVSASGWWISPEPSGDG